MSATTTDLWRMSARELAEVIRSKQASSQEVIEAYFEVGKDLTTSGVAVILHGMCMAVAINALGLPAVALPVGTGDGLPQSVQVIGPRYREDLCFDAAAALEDQVGIITRIDPR